jgi:hypothetical protein
MRATERREKGEWRNGDNYDRERKKQQDRETKRDRERESERAVNEDI